MAGKKLKINEISIQLPDQPPLKEIFGSDRKKKDQRWRRTPLPENWDFLDSRERRRFAKQEFERRANGFWFMNNGVPTYITGNHYFYLNWCKIDIGYPDFRDRDRRFFLFWDACKQDPNSFGMQMIKHRREGASWKGACMALYDITSTYNAHGGLLSKTGKDASELFQKVVYMFRNMPPFFQPMIDGTDNPKSVLSFNKPGERITKTTQGVQKSNALNSKIDWRNTKENSYDSTKLKYFMCDESGKWEEADVSKNWQIVKPCLSVGHKIIGTAFLPSTVNEMTKGGGMNFKNIWDDSNPEERDANGRTKSGLYRYFTPAYDGYEGFIDEYGMSVIETPDKPIKGCDGVMITMGSKEYLQNVRDSLKNDTVKLAEHKRQFPWTAEEALRVDSRNCVFDAEKIHTQLDYIDSMVRPMTHNMDLVWNADKTKVTAVPTKNGRWLVSWMPDAEERNATVIRRGKRAPSNEAAIVAGCDPYDHSTTTDGKRSNAAAYVFRKYNPAMPLDTHMFVAEYINRPPTVHMFYDDMLKMCVFYGCQILVENNKVGLINYFEEKGFGEYLMERPEVTHTANSRGQKIKGLPTSGQAVINSIIDAIQVYVYEAVGYDDESGEVGRCFFPRLLTDWAEFEPDNRTKYDASMASGIALLAAQKHVKPKKEKPKAIQFVKRYNNKGSISKLIR